MYKYKNISRVVSTIVATVIGAGFATGQEIFTFFCAHGKWGMLGLLSIFVLLYFVLDTVFLYCHKHSIVSFGAFVSTERFCGMSAVVEAFVAAFSFCGLCAMAAATGALFEQVLKLPYIVGVVCLLFCSALVLNGDISGITKANSLLAPMICIGLLFVCVRGILFRDVETFSHYYQQMFSGVRDGVLYVSYNLLSLIVVACPLSAYLKNKKQIRVSALLGSVALSGLACLIWFVLCIYKNKIYLSGIPLLDIAARSGGAYVSIYSILLFCSVFSTAIGCGYGAIDYLRIKCRMQTRAAVSVVMLSAVPVCLLGFEEIVRVLYTFFGYLGLPFLIYLLGLRIKTRKEDK